MIEITSRKNKTVLDALALHEKKTRDREGRFFIEGAKLFGEALSSGRKPLRVFVTEKYFALHPEVEELDTGVIRVTDEVFAKITDESAPEGIFAIFEKKNIKPVTELSAILILEGIQDPGNVGTLLRSAVAFGVREVITVDCADIYSPKTVRASMGAIFKIPCTAFSDIETAVDYARGVADVVVATALHADSVSVAEVNTATAAIMIGSEGRGLSERAIALADKKVIIPIENIESLNASVAGAICMYDAMLKRKKL